MKKIKTSAEMIPLHDPNLTTYQDLSIHQKINMKAWCYHRPVKDTIADRELIKEFGSTTNVHAIDYSLDRVFYFIVTC